ncbi:small GTP-binding protein domain [Faecalitalea cylindroides T2-87]|uniref:Translation initiation factor IF-2 n=1 Tax=Faecalitalea cylindroides T2-87 TaxID=717960 RepID=D4JCT1_9FIRM|nr:small GTP-binding protein domain [Faecalitalea cylindroides T2-87]
MPNNNRPRRKPSKKGPNKHKNTNSAPRKVEAVKEITYSDSLTVGQLANLLHKNSSEIIKFLFMMGNMSTINTVLSDDDIELICMEFGVVVHKEVIIDEDDIEEQIGNIEEDDSKMVPRPPVVTIMGHVDHGKTTLLDTIRKTNVTSGEFGGITQHIGAYQVSLKGRKVTFLDTPGHEAFTAMRARGAQVTDIVIIVVAADDGVMPQTKEAVDHAKAAGVPIVVAVNKIDKPGANPDRIMSEMAELGIMPEEWGGDTIFMNVSAKQGTGVSDLLETVLLVADMAELKANPDQLASGTVIEAKLDKGRGPVATLLVQRGTLHSGDSIVVGTSYGRVRKMTNDKGMEIKKAEPSCPVEIIGLNDVPRAGDVFMAYDNYKKAQEIASHRLEKQIEKSAMQQALCLWKILPRRLMKVT